MRHPLIEHQQAIGLDPLLPVPFWEDSLKMKLQPCGIRTELSYSLATVQAKKFQITGEKLAEGALRITAWQRTKFSAATIGSRYLMVAVSGAG